MIHHRIIRQGLIAAFAALSAGVCLAANFTSTQSVPAGQNWNGNFWSTNTDGSGTLFGPPTAGNTYELLPKLTITSGNDTRTRNPASPGAQTFPGDSLMMDVNSDLRFKGPGAIVTFPGPGGGLPGLILNGGGFNIGDDGKFWLDGIIEVRQQSYIFPSTSGAVADNRALNIMGLLIGTNNLAMINAGLLAAVEISHTNNPFSGQWIVKSGLLYGSANGSLGTNSILIDPNWAVPPTNGAWTLGGGYNKAVVSIGYDLNSAGSLTIANGGQIVLYKNHCFTAVTINGNPLAPGSYSYATLAAAYPNNILGNGYGNITVQPYGTPPSFPPPTNSPAQQWLTADISNPTHAGSVVTNGDGTLDIQGGGDDIWNNTSHFRYYYSWASGTNWDISMQVKNFTGPDTWSKVELLVSPADPNVGPVGNDAFIAMMDTQVNWANAPGVSGQNIGGVDQFRTVKNGASDWLQIGNNPIPDYPNNWVRITRNGSAFDLYRSSDGQYWRKYVTVDTANSITGGGGTKFNAAWPNLVTVGIAVTAHNDGSTLLGDANVANLQANFPPAQPPTVLVPRVQIVSGVTNAYGCEASLTFAATNNAFPTPALVPVSYQWYKNGSPIASATSSAHTWLLDTGDDTAQFYCTATCAPPYSSLNITSGVATIGVVAGVYYTNGLKLEMLTGGDRVGTEQGNVNAASSISIEPALDEPGGYGNNYATRSSGWFIPPTTDNYTFFLACDDDSDFFVSTDSTMGNKRMVAQETAWSGTRSWLAAGGGVLTQKRSDQWSPDGGATIPYAAGIPLTAGQPYYIELVHHQGGGGDNFGVTYQTSTNMNDPNWSINFTNGAPSLLQASSSCLVLVTRAPTTLAWVQQPTNTTATLGLSGTFYAKAASDAELALKYQWYREGALIPGATGSAYSIASVAAPDNGAHFMVVATTAENELSITSAPTGAVLNVAAPVLESGWAKMEYWYSPNPGIATFRVNQTNGSGIATNILLSTSYSIPPNNTIFEPIFEGNSKQSAPAGYTSRLSAFFYPPTTGDYVFFVNSDDPGDLFVSTDSNPANARLVAQETSWSGSWNWNSVGGGGGTTATKRSDQWTAPDGSVPWSAGIHMIAGQQYYVAIIHQDTGGGNNCEATFKLTSDPDPANGTYSRMQGSLVKTFVPRCFSMAFSQQPVNATVPFNGNASFTAQGTTDSKSAIGDETDPSLQWNSNYVMYQWYRNGTPIAGANGSSFTFGPVSPDDSTASFVCQIRALGFVDNSLNPLWLTSSIVNITVSGNPVYETNFVLHAYYGLNPPRNAIRDGTAGSPTWLMAEPAFEADVTGANIAQNFSDELIGFFIPPTTGDYVFFCNSDDGAELYLSTDNSAINKRLIAQETGFAGALQWGASGGTVSQVRSDTFVDPTTGTTPYSSGIHLIGGQKYFMAIIHSQGGGGTESCVNAKLIGDPDPAVGSLSTVRSGKISCYVPKCNTVTVTNQPQNVTVTNYSSATFTTGGSTDSTVPVGNEGDWRTQFSNFLFYQWYKNGQPIAGATASTLTLQNVLPSDNGSTIFAKMRALGYADGSGNALWAQSSSATLNVITSAPPTLQFSGYYINYGTSGGAIPQPCVTLHFSGPMDPVALQNQGNYVLGGGLSITGTLYNSNSYSSVTLLVSGTPTFPFNVTINNASALGGGPPLAGSHTISVAQAVLSSADIGAANDPAFPSYIDVFGANAFLVSCEGSDIWNNADGFNYLYEARTGDFNVIMRQKSLTKVSNWTKGGVMIRESLDPSSREWCVVNTPLDNGVQASAADGTGANIIQGVRRTATGGPSDEWVAHPALPPSYPNAWLMLARRTVTNLDTTVHTWISGYYSTDGLNWTFLGQDDTTANGDSTPLPDTVYVGIASTAHHNDAVGAWPLLYLNNAQYDSYNSAFVPTHPTITSSVSGGNLVISWAPAGGHLESSPAIGAGAVWTPVTPNPYTSPAVIPIGPGTQFFRVVFP